MDGGMGFGLFIVFFGMGWVGREWTLSKGKARSPGRVGYQFVADAGARNKGKLRACTKLMRYLFAGEFVPCQGKKRRQRHSVVEAY